MMGRYILDENLQPVSCHNLYEWHQWMQENYERRIVGRTRIGGLEVSTVFLALDHSLIDEEYDPVLYETCIFQRPEELELPASEVVERYCTREQAIAGHEKWVQRTKEVICE